MVQPHTPATQERRPTLQERKALTRNAIVEAAGDLFREQGIDETSMAQIAKRAETGVGTLYGYFPSKDDLLREVLQQLTRASVDRYFASVTEETSHVDRLLTALNVYSDFLEKNRVILRSAFMAGTRHEIASELVSPAYAAYCGFVRDGITAGEFQPLPVESTVRVLLTSYTMAFLGLGAWAGDEDKRSTREELEAITRSMVRKR